MDDFYDDVLRDSVDIAKEDGQTFKGIKASVHKDKVFIIDISLPVEEGDLVLRKLPNGFTERYVIIDTGFSQGLDEIPSSYNMMVKKQTLIPTKDVSQTITQHFHGNVGSVATGSSNFHQTANINPVGQQLNMNFDPVAMRAEITKLLATLKQQADEPEQFDALSDLSAAEKAIAADDKPKMIEHLKSAGQKAGKWVFDGATSVGVTLLAELLKKYLNM